MKKEYFISFFIIFLSLTGLNSIELSDTFWVALTESDEMKALLVVNLQPGHQCLLTHAYLRHTEEAPFDWDSTREEWYQAKEDLLIIQDSWGEFIPLTIVNQAGQTYLQTKLGQEEIILHNISLDEWKILEEEFSLKEEQEVLNSGS